MRRMFNVLVMVSLAAWLMSASQPVRAGENLLRNGSFEGGKRYWFEAWDRPIVQGDAVHGSSAMRIDQRGVQSAAMLLQPGKPVTLSFWARAAEGDRATLGWQITPSDREHASRLGLTWGLRGKHPVKVTAKWQRYTATFTPQAPQTGLWPRPTYMLQIGDSDKPVLLDAISIAYDGDGETYLPYRPVEAFVDCPDLKGYVSEQTPGNLLQRGQDITLLGTATNNTSAEATFTFRWQFIDYEGSLALTPAVEKRVAVPAGRTVSESVAMKLSPAGLVLGRFSVVGDDGKVIDSSDVPLCSLPYPKAATKPDFRERFGGSIWGMHVGRLHQRIGMPWTRWWPHMNWADHQKTGPDEWKFFDDVLDQQQSIGISTHAVLYGKPKWAFASEKDVLPKDMQWDPADPRWEDLSVRTAWDTFVARAVEHYKGRSLIYEIENEPELDHWDRDAKAKDQYARFTVRTARLIKQVDPSAKVMVDNVYGIPSALNAHMLRYAKSKGWEKSIDVISWHDYHEGWLADGVAMRRMENNLRDLGCGHIEIWFNEGWAFTNTAVDEPGGPALTNHSAARSVNAMVNSVAELTANGQKKTILFHTGYEKHGMSFWDYSGPGTMLWDYYGYPMGLVPAWNVLSHHVGLSEEVGQVRPESANLCFFQDLRNGRGVVVAYADRDAKADVKVTLPFDAIAEDAMGNPVKLDGRTLTLSQSGRTVFLWTAGGTSAKELYASALPIDRKNASFVTTTAGAGKSWKLPPAWEGAAAGKADGNPALADGKPVWRLDQVYPPDPTRPESYRPFVWREGWWRAAANDFGGQPKAEMKDSALRLEFRASHGNPAAERVGGLCFICPEAGTYHVTGSATLRLWENAKNPVRLTLLKKSASTATEVAQQPLVAGSNAIKPVAVELAAGDELVLLPRINGGFAGGDILLSDLRVNAGAPADGGAAGGVAYRLPAAWEGTAKGTADNNPIKAGDVPLWRVDQLWPDDPMFAANYAPMTWDGTAWNVLKNGAGGQPSVRVENGAAKIAVRGPWGGGGDNAHTRVAGLVFMTPKPGIYRVRGVAAAKPWTGGGKTYKLGVFKKDTQRATQELVVELPRDATRVPINLKVELSAGHELVFLPLMAGQWNNALTCTIEDLVIELQPEPKP